MMPGGDSASRFTADNGNSLPTVRRPRASRSGWPLVQRPPWAILTLLFSCATAPARPVAQPAYPPLVNYVAIFAAGVVIGGATSLAVQKACRCP